MKNDVPSSRPKPEKVCPITFHLDPVTTLQRNFAAAIEKTNAALAQKLAGLRLAILGTPKAPPNYDEKTYVEKFRVGFKSTYLKDPVLRGDDRKLYKGWAEIVPYFAKIIPGTTFLAPQGVNVYLEYLPIMEQKFTKTRETFGDEIDFLASIRTVIAYAPHDDPMEIGNTAPIPHRKVCDPIF
ncbi:MAG: hypothetical protein NT147_07380 [Candidatus Aminicenantes bacterium]|nr:hypothetical protein [Candidatus Aminicenantes bacterium]